MRTVIRKIEETPVVMLQEHERAALELIASINCDDINCNDCPLNIGKKCLSVDAKNALINSHKE